MMKFKSFFIKTFGCQMNERDSEIMAQALSPYGYVECMELDTADLVILNTCSIRAKAEQKVMSLLGYLRKIKNKRPQMKICVAGCVAQQEGRKIIERMPHVDLVIGTQNIYGIGKHLEETSFKKNKVVVDLEDNYVIPRFMPDVGGSSTSSHISANSQEFKRFVTIMQGCNNFCTYCVVPHTRGREVSRKVNDIVDEVRALIEGGVREITLLGQNVNSYGKTNSVSSDRKYGFAQLVHEIASIPDLKRLRFTTSNPKDLDENLMACFGELDNLCPQFHLPVQAGSDAVLKRMNRKYSVEAYLDKVYKLHEHCPEICLTTDVIVGFPGETDEDFEGTMNLLNEVRFHGSFSFKYSDRPGTKAKEYTDKVAEDVKSERLSRFQKRQDEISLERNNEYIGQVKEVLVEELLEDTIKTRSDTNHIVHIPQNAESPSLQTVIAGSFVSALITHAGQHSLKGKLV